MSTRLSRSILTASLSVFLLLQAASVFAAGCGGPAPCPSTCQPCNNQCIEETDLCILEPPPGGSSVINSVGINVILDYINGSAGSAGIWAWAFKMGVAIAVLNGVFGGFQIVLSNGDSGAIDAGKKRFIGSAIGLALLILSGVILNFINPYGFGTSTTPALP